MSIIFLVNYIPMRINLKWQSYLLQNEWNDCIRISYRTTMFPLRAKYRMRSCINHV